MSMLLILVTMWAMLSLPLALIVGRALRFAGRRTGSDWTEDVEQFLREQPRTRATG